MQVAVYNFKTVVITVFIAVFAKPHHISFVHAYMYFARGEALGKRGKNFIYKLIGSVIVRQQNIRRVVYCAVAVYPFEHGVKVRKGLYAGYKLYTVFTAVFVRFLKLCL